MRKWFVLVLIVSAVVVWPYVMGHIAEKSVSKQLGEKLALGSQAEMGYLLVSDYQRNAFTSSFRVKYSAPKELIEAKVYTGAEPRLFCDAVHFWWRYEYDCRVENEGYAEFYKNTLEQEKDPLTLIGSVSVLGNIQQTVQLKEQITFSEVDAQKEIAVTILPARFHVTTDKEQKEWEFDGEFAGMTFLEVGGKGFEMKVSAISTTGDMEAIDGSQLILLGDSEMSTTHLSIKNAGEDIFTLNDLVVKTLADEAKQVDNAIDVFYYLDIASITQKTSEIFPELLENISIKSNVLSLTEAALQAFESLSTNQVGDISAKKRFVEQVFTKDLQLAFSIDALMDSKPFALNADVYLKEDMKVEKVVGQVMQDPNSLAQMFGVTANARVAKSTVAQVPKLRNVMQFAGSFFSIKDDEYTLKFSMNEGDIVLNGEKIDLGNLKF